MILLDNEEYNKIRTKLVNLIAKINNVIINSIFLILIFLKFKNKFINEFFLVD